MFRTRELNLLDRALTGDLAMSPQRWKGSRVYTTGESLFFHARSEKPAYLTLIHLQGDGNVFVLFPNRVAPSVKMQPGRVVTFPNEELERTVKMKLTVSPPFGEDIILGIATDKPLDFKALGLPELGKGASVIRSSGKEGRAFAGAAFLEKLSERLHRGDIVWAEDRVMFATSAE